MLYAVFEFEAQIRRHVWASLCVIETCSIALLMQLTGSSCPPAPYAPNLAHSTAQPNSADPTSCWPCNDWWVCILLLKCRIVTSIQLTIQLS